MKNELSWIPLASGSAASEVLTGDGGPGKPGSQAMTERLSGSLYLRA
jgi:hypothetical protein